MSDMLDALRPLVDQLVEEKLAKLTKVDEYLSASVAADVASVSVKTVRRWIADGKLKRYGVGRKLLLRRVDLDKLLSGSRRSPVDNDVSIDELARKMAARAK